MYHDACRSPRSIRFILHCHGSPCFCRLLSVLVRQSCLPSKRNSTNLPQVNRIHFSRCPAMLRIQKTDNSMAGRFSKHCTFKHRQQRRRHDSLSFPRYVRSSFRYTPAQIGPTAPMIAIIVQYYRHNDLALAVFPYVPLSNSNRLLNYIPSCFILILSCGVCSSVV